MTPRRLTLVTGNRAKLHEIRRIVAPLGTWELEAVALDLPEIQSLDLHEVLEAKAAEAWRRLGRPLVVEETGLEIAAWNGFPGPLVKWMLAAMGPEGVARAALAAAEAGASAAVTARCAALHVDGERRVFGEGVEPGRLILPARGGHGFGWDPVFLPEGEAETYGELPDAVKDRRGHRGKAWRSLLANLEGADA